jgi:hypothetical protein
MALSLSNLDHETRRYMLEEIDRDNHNRTLYLSPRLSGVGLRDYPTLLSKAAESHDDAWLASELRSQSRLNTSEQRRKPKGGFTTVAVPITAADTLAEGEFNRFYIRGLCRLALDREISRLVVYRAKSVANPRPESIAKEGTDIDPRALLEDLRTSPGVDTALGLPPGPNSGLSAKLP